jgi:transposase-like protein
MSKVSRIAPSWTHALAMERAGLPPARSSAEILSACAADFDIPVEDLLGAGRTKRCVAARAAAAYALHLERLLSWARVGEKLRGRDHATVLNLAARHSAQTGLPPLTELRLEPRRAWPLRRGETGRAAPVRPRKGAAISMGDEDMNESWSLADLRRVYAALITDKQAVAEAAKALGFSANTLDASARALLILPRDLAPPRSVVEEIWRRSVERPHLTTGELEALKTEWVKPGATVRDVALKLRRRPDLVRRRARSMGLGEVGSGIDYSEPTISPDARRAAEAIVRPHSCLDIAEAANLYSASKAAVREALRELDPDHEALERHSVQWLRLGEGGPKISQPELVARRLAPLKARARRLVGAGVTCPHALARELDPLREHRLTPDQALALAKPEPETISARSQEVAHG